MSQKYELQAARIESVLSAHKVAARVWQATVTPRFVRFDVTTALGTRLTKVSGSGRGAGLLAGRAGHSAVYREGGVLHVEVPRDTPRTVGLLGLCGRLSSVPPNCAVLGVDEGGVPLLVRLDSPDVAHLLLAGTTGQRQDGPAAHAALDLGDAQPGRPPADGADRPQESRLECAGGVAARLAAGGPGRRCGRDRRGGGGGRAARPVGGRDGAPGCGRLQPAAAGGGHRRAGRPVAGRRQGRGGGADPADAARPRGGACTWWRRRSGRRRRWWAGW